MSRKLVYVADKERTTCQNCRFVTTLSGGQKDGKPSIACGYKLYTNHSRIYVNGKPAYDHHYCDKYEAYDPKKKSRNKRKEENK